MQKKLKMAAMALLMMGLSSAAAFADSITFNLSNTIGEAPASGGSYTFAATVSAPSSNNGVEYLNEDSFNVTSPITLDDTDFLGFPLSLSPGDSYTGDLFTLTVPPGTAFGTYLGTFTLLGGATAGSLDTLGTVNFALTTTPEPSSIVLLLTGASVLFWAGSRRKLGSWAR